MKFIRVFYVCLYKKEQTEVFLVGNFFLLCKEVLKKNIAKTFFFNKDNNQIYKFNFMYNGT